MNAQFTQAIEVAQLLPENLQSAIATLITEVAKQPSDHFQEIESYIYEMLKERILQENARKEKAPSLNKQFQQALEKVRQLSVDHRGAIVDCIWRALSEREWQTFVNQPHIQQQLHNLYQQALAGEETKDEGAFEPSWRTKHFDELLAKLPAEIQKEAKEAYTHFLDADFVSSLQFRCIHQHDPIYSMRVGKRHHAIAWYQDCVAHWFWIGSSEDYNSPSQLPTNRGDTDEERLQLAIEIASQLPSDFQSVLAEEILTEMSVQKWDALFSSPEGQRWLEKSADEAAAEYQAGKTLEGGFGEDEESLHSVFLETL